MNRGYTIIELVVVISVLAILITMAAFGTSTAIDRGRNSEAKSKLLAIKSALEKYYAKNNEYPSAESLANGGDGRNLSDAQYNTIASTLDISKDVLKGGSYKFVPCVVSGSPCTITQNDSRAIIYMTRMASDVSSNVQRAYTTPSSGCDYRFLKADTSNEYGYTAFFLSYRDPTNSDWWTQWNVYQSDHGRMWRGDWCPVTSNT